MANNPWFTDAVVIAALNTVATTLNGGFLMIYTGSQPGDANQAVTGTLLAKLPLGATAFSAATASGATGSRVATANANSIGSAAALATGTAGYFVLYKSDGLTVVGMGSVGTSGADLNLNSLSITSGVLVTCSAFSLTQPES